MLPFGPCEGWGGVLSLPPEVMSFTSLGRQPQV